MGKAGVGKSSGFGEGFAFGMVGWCWGLIFMVCGVRVGNGDDGGFGVHSGQGLESCDTS